MNDSGEILVILEPNVSNYMLIKKEKVLKFQNWTNTWKTN